MMLVGWTTFVSILLLSGRSGGFPSYPGQQRDPYRGALKRIAFRGSSRSSSDRCSRIQTSALCAANDDGSFVLPVFPLRKSVKLPSEPITLNLYEERYLELAEYVLNHDGLFGALYCSHKPQIVKSAQGPIVPMIDEGDVGVVCQVLQNEDSIVPVLRNEPSGTRRRIKLRGVAVGRFRVVNVLHNGYGGGGSTSEEALQFILVEAEHVDDFIVNFDSKEDANVLELEKQICECMLGRRGYAGIQDTSDGSRDDTVTDESDSTTEGIDLTGPFFRPLLPSHVAGDVQLTQANNESWQSNMACALLSWRSTNEDEWNEISIERQRRQLLSFAAISALCSNKTPNDMLKLLKTLSTLERLQYISKNMNRSVFKI